MKDIDVITTIVIGVIMLASFFWQRHIFNSPQSLRLAIPFYSGILVVLGIFVYGIIALFAGNIQDLGGFWSWLGRVFLAIFFALSILLKAQFSAIVLGFVLSSFFYNFIISEEINSIPIFEALINLVFPNSPQWVHPLYSFIVIVYVLIASIADSFSWNWRGLNWNIFRWWSD